MHYLQYVIRHKFKTRENTSMDIRAIMFRKPPYSFFQGKYSHMWPNQH
jgi:hypothetical protein